MIHNRKTEIPEHPVIADMERFGIYPYRRNPEHFRRKGAARRPHTREGK